MPGTYSIKWDGKNSSGEDVSSGIYLYRLTAGDIKETKKMVLLR
jgi:flagellar hook assembly protein FlgD